VLETIDALAGLGFHLHYEYRDENRRGDHICYISDIRKLRLHFPEWSLAYDLPRILSEIVERNQQHAVVQA